MSIVYKALLCSLLFLLVAVQTAFIPVFISPFPDLLIVVVSAFCWTGRKSEALWAAFLGGIFYDLLTVHPTGIRSLLLIAIVMALSFVRNRADNFFLRFLSIFIAALGWHFYPSLLDAELFFGSVVLLALLDAVAVAAFYPLLARLFKHPFWEEDLQLSFRDKLG